MTKKIYALGVCAVLLLAGGGFVRYEKAQAKNFLDDLNGVTEKLMAERDYFTAMDKYRGTLVGLAKANPVAMRQAFYIIDHEPDPVTDAGWQRYQIRWELAYVVLKLAFPGLGDDVMGVAGPGPSYPWLKLGGQWRIGWGLGKYSPLEGSLSNMLSRCEQYGHRRSPSEF